MPSLALPEISPRIFEIFLGICTYCRYILTTSALERSLDFTIKKNFSNLQRNVIALKKPMMPCMQTKEILASMAANAFCPRLMLDKVWKQFVKYLELKSETFEDCK